MIKLLVYSLALFSLATISCYDNEPCTTCPSPTVDTTSHAYTWQFRTVGAVGRLWDITIVNDSLAYAVGELYTRDSTGAVESLSRCVAIWNGITWELKRLFVDGTQLLRSVRGVYVRRPGDIWLASGSVFHWDGQSDQVQTSMARLSFPDPTPFVTNIWGSGSHIYAVGNGGTVMSFDGTQWQRLQSGTALDIKDVWGGHDPQTGEEQVLAVASDDVRGVVLRIQGSTVSPVFDNGLPGLLRSVWFVPNERYFVVGDGICQSGSLTGTYWQVDTLGAITTSVSERVRGTAWNDIFVVGNFLEVLHFNGATWHNYRDVIPISLDGVYGRITMRGGLVIIIGLSGQYAIAAIGRRQQ